jgi:hypothetical protein
LLVAGAAMVVLGVTAIFALTAGLQSFLRSESFRRLVSEKTCAALKARGEFMPLQFSGSMIYSEGFQATGNEQAFFSTLRADQIRAELDLRALYHRALRINELRIERLTLQGKTPHAAHAIAQAAPERRPFFAPTSLDLRSVFIRETNFSWSGVSGAVRKAALTIKPDGRSWDIMGEGGDVAQQGLPDLQIQTVKLRYQSPSLFVTDSVLTAADGGRLTLNGEANFERSVDLRMTIASMPVTPFLKGDWRARLKGTFSGEIKMTAALPLAGAPSFNGTLHMNQGQIEALPLLNQIALFTRTEQFRSLRLSRMSLDFAHDGTLLTVKNFLAESEGLIRAEGAFVVRGGQIEGNFEIGVTPGSLQWIPGSQSRVFTVARGGYLWTSVRVSGAAEHPSEDLSARLIVAAGNELLENPGSTLKKAAEGLLDIVKPLLK